MALTPGTRLGAYEVVAQIGMGGMGEVYRATDTTLGRQVAIKVLPEALASDAERIARFEREAKTLAALNHPNIAQIHGFEKSNGVHALVMELVEGPTLADRIAHGPIPLDEALPIAKQIAEALEAAHEQGIIHRDLKPANIKVRPDGTVKVLDFGLAKAMEPAGAMSASASMSPTITSPAMMTGVGMILGTAAYMSPEQARGKAVDKRSDIWAFGCVIFEMLTGKRAFDGDDVQDTFVAIMRDEPDWARLPVDTPSSIRVLVLRCFQKDPRKRIGDIAVALFVLDESRNLVDSPHGPVVRKARNVRKVAVIGAAAALIAVGFAGVFWQTRRAASPEVVRLEIPTAGAAALTVNGAGDIAITPDGSRVVYRGQSGLFVRALGELEPRPLTAVGTLGSYAGLTVSPDGKWIGFFDGGQLKKVAIEGGPPVTIASVDRVGILGNAWGADGSIIYATNALDTGLQRVSERGGTTTVLTRPDVQRGEADHVAPEFLPDGRGVLFTITPVAGGLENAKVAILNLADGTYKVVLSGGTHAHYVPTGHLVYGAGGTLRAVAFDLDRQEVLGAPVPVIQSIATAGGGGIDIAIANNGTTAYVSGRPEAGRSLVWVDRLGLEESLGAPVAGYVYPRLSPDGARVALDVAGQNRDIWVWDLRAQRLTRLTSDPSDDVGPVWTPDSRRIVFSSTRSRGVSKLFEQDANGAGAAERMIETDADDASQWAPSFAPDGKTFVFHGQFRLSPSGQSPEFGTRYDIMTASLEGDRHVTTLIRTPFQDRNPHISPDGSWIAYDSDESGRYEVYVRPYPDTQRGRWQISTAGGHEPLWSPTGNELFYRGLNGALMGTRVPHETGWTNTKPETIFEKGYFVGMPGGSNPTYDVARDGRFLMIKEQMSQSSPSIVIVQNWLEELKRLVPSR